MTAAPGESGRAWASGREVSAARPILLRPWRFGAAVVLAGATAAVGTVAWQGSMAGGMPMPGGWSMSMAWMRMPGQSWPAAALAFAAMWTLMMVAMMLPSVAPVLWSASVRARRSGGPGGRSPAAKVAAGYFLVWALAGLAIYPLGVAVAVAEMRWEPVARAAPAATGLVLLLAGLLQLTRWKTRELVRCRPGSACALGAGQGGGLRAGARVGLHCCLCCSSLMAVQLALGVMDLGAMAAVALAITAERLAPRPARVARATGVALIGVGALLVARAGA